ncbi:hypothetical protein, partial [Streptomyces scabiei]|uniref:hypothetical protein n=1 Tax=Streptomyces scabiei TaxID=1930 RepID=UPI0029A82DB7
GVDVGAKVLAVFVLAEISLLLVFGVVMLLRGGERGYAGRPRRPTTRMTADDAPAGPTRASRCPPECSVDA